MNPYTVKNSTKKPVDSFVPRSPYETSNHTIMLKVREDMLFLEDRIERMTRQKTPNTTVLKTYQKMLENRESVLEWLRENDVQELENNQLSSVG